MALTDGRAVVRDPLALNVGQVAPERSLQLMSVKNPQQQGGTGHLTEASKTLGAIAKLQGALEQVHEGQKENWITEGKLQYMQGATEEQIRASGNEYTMQGWQALNVSDKANVWFQQEQNEIKNGQYESDPESYRKGVMERRAKFLENLPQDPAIRKLYAAKFDDLAPRLVTTQMAAHNEYNKVQSENSFSNALESGARTNYDASSRGAGQPLPLSPGQVRTTFKASAYDRDILIRTVVGESASEGNEGMAAVAHNILNRVQDGRFAPTIAGVALQPKQYSAWNNGPGGNSLVKKGPGDPSYERAAKVVDAVLSGRHADPTNGATHYYSPGGMEALKREGSQSHLVPRWWGKVTAESGGFVTIGGHRFAGKARNGQTGSYVGAEADAQNERGAPDNNPQTPDKWANTDIEDLRRESKNPLYSPAIKAEMEESIRRRETPKQTGTVEAFNGYDGEADVAKSTPVAEAAKLGVNTRETPSGPTPQIQALIRGYGNIKNDKKGDILANSIIKMLNADDDQLYRDAGGIGMLNELGANPALIRQVQSAQKQFKQRSLNKFSLEDRKWESALYTKIENNELTPDDALEELNKRFKDGEISDQRAQAISNKIITEGKRLGKEYNLSPEVMRQSLNIFQKVQTKELTAEEADAEVRKLGEQHGLPKKQIDSYITDIWNEEKRQFAQAKTNIATRAKEAQKLQADVDEARSAIVTNNMDGLTGTMVRPDPKTGVNTHISKKQWAVEEMKASEYAKAKEAAQATMDDAGSALTPEEAQARAMATAQATIYSHLRKQGVNGVVDEGLSNSITNATRGVVIDPKTRRPTPEALEAFETYVRLGADARVGEAYMDRYLQNEQSRDLLQTAKLMLTGGYDLDTALIKAAEWQSAKKDAPEYKSVSDDPVIQEKIKTKIDSKVKEIAGDGYLFPGAIRGADQKLSPFAQEKARAVISRLADTYAMRNPHNDPEVNLNKAADDYANGAIIVGNNIVYGDPKSKKRLDQTMGLEGMGKDAPHKAITAAVLNYVGDRIELFNNKKEDTKIGRYARQDLGFKSKSQLEAFAMSGQSPFAYNLTYDPVSQMATVQFWKNEERKEVADTQPIVLHLPTIGRRYLERQSQPGIIANVWGAIREGVAGLGSKARKDSWDAAAREKEARTSQGSPYMN